MSDALPRKDSELAAFALHLATRVNADPAFYGIPAESAAACLQRAQAFDAAHRLAITPASNTLLTRQEKRAARAELESDLRPMILRIRGSTALSPSDRSQLGLRDRARWHRNPAPRSHPVIDVVEVRGFDVKIALRDSEELTHCRIPRGVRSVIVFSCIGKQPKARLADWTMLGTFSRARLSFELPTYERAGAPVWVAACWTNGRSETGRMSPAVNIHGATIVPRSGEPMTPRTMTDAA